ncbi:MAG: YraN family protein [Phycisphaerales bacterium JB043]
MAFLRRASSRSSVGDRGESIASRYLKKQRFRVLRRNLDVGVGEADIVCLSPDRKTLVVVEVKTRTMSETSTTVPESGIDAHKRRKLVRVAHACARTLRWGDRSLRIDVVAVEMREGEDPVIRHHENAVTG